MHHPDTTLWLVQVVTGFCLFFLVSAHLYIVIAQPGNIGPYASSDRIWTGNFWILYALLLVAVHLHAGIGMYRLAMKWGPLSSDNTAIVRARLKIAMWCCVVFFLCLGTASLLTYMTIGYEHADRAGERYRPGAERQPGEGA